ncbi:unnamed protein product, partial [marine sediment metagenome]
PIFAVLEDSAPSMAIIKSAISAYVYKNFVD